MQRPIVVAVFLSILPFSGLALQVDGDEFPEPQLPDPSVDSGLRIVVEGDQFVVRGQPELIPEQPRDVGRGSRRPGGRRPGSLVEADEEELYVGLTRLGITSSDLAEVTQVDIGSAIQQSTDASPSTGFRQNSPVSQLPYLRGYRGGQIYAVSDGQYWQAARPDLDSMLSRIDPSLIEDVVIINGPYGLRYGPGFGFIDVQTYDTPRYLDGYESHARIGTSFRFNGGQVFGRAAAFGGSSDWGYVINYTDRTGADYRSGGDATWARIPSSYRVQSYLGQIGFDLSPELSVEFRFSQIDQSDTEYAAQIFDILEAPTTAFNLALVYEDPYGSQSHRVEAWNNRSHYLGDTRSASKHLAAYPVIDRVNAALDAAFPNDPPANFAGDTDGDIVSTGARLLSEYGEEGSIQLNLGADVRYIEQHIHERLVSDKPLGTPDPTDPTGTRHEFETNMPRAEMIDPGIFAELTAPMTSFWTSSVGGRIDWVHTDAQATGGLPDGLRTPSSLTGAPGSLPQSDSLLAFYIRNDIELDYNLGLNLSAGYADRAPTLIERYADGVFLGTLQSGFTRTIGDPSLRKERLWQVDMTLNAESEFQTWRASATAYCAWIKDFITYQGFLANDPTGARLLRTANGSLATLAGVDLKGELLIAPWLSGIGTFSYIEGRDRWMDRPMVGIIPMEGRAALRLHDSDGGAIWGLEFGARMVDGQDRVADLFRLDMSIEEDYEQPTAGFTTFHVRGYWNVTDNLFVTAGVENLFDKTYIEHLNVRLPADANNNFAQTPVLAPGVTPYINIEWTR